MSEIREFCQSLFSLLVVVFTVSNLASMGLQVVIPQAARKAREPKFLLLVLVWGWVVGPALGYLITRILPLAEPFAIVILITSLAPCAPFLPPMVEKAKGDLGFAGAFIPVTALGTVVFMPLMGPLLIKGLTLDALMIAKPLVLTVLIPLIFAALIRTYAAPVANRISRPVKMAASLSTALTVLIGILLYGGRMLEMAGSLALASMTIFMGAMGFITYCFGFGLSQNEKSVMSLGMGTRNIAAVFAAIFAIPNADPRMAIMVVMWALWSFVLAKTAALVFARKAGKTMEGKIAGG